MTFSINGKTAIVTGAANGVGLAIARHFLDHGANVMFADMDEARLKDEVGEAASNEDTPARVFAGDLREKLTVANLLSDWAITHPPPSATLRPLSSHPSLLRCLVKADHSRSGLMPRWRFTALTGGMLAPSLADYCGFRQKGAGKASAAGRGPKRKGLVASASRGDVQGQGRERVSCPSLV